MRRHPLSRPALPALLMVILMGTAGAALDHSTRRVPGDVFPVSQDTTITPAMIALGDSIFRGRVAGGTCIACHGPAAKGMPGLAPDLTDAKWLHGDGSLAFLERVIESGVPKPKEAAAAMPPGGGSRLSPAQLRAVAAYVYSLSHPEVRRTR